MATMSNPSRSVTTRKCYTLAVADGKSAEITMYGEIVETQPVDWWTGEPVDGLFIILSDFLADLDTIRECDEITIRMNSVGGDAYSAIAIHNRLRGLKAHKTCIVDGVAMSGGSLIMCACDRTVVYPGSLVLWHHAWVYARGQYNCISAKKMVDDLETCDKSQIEIYMRKTGKSKDEVLSILEEERCLTGREAVESGLADELVDDDDSDPNIAVSSDKRTLYVRGRPMKIAAMGELPDNIKTVVPATSGDDKNQPEPSGKTEGGEPMPKTVAELKQEYPELAEALLAEAKADALLAEAKADAQASTASAVEAERKRLSDIDAIASLYDAKTVNDAKYGEHACSAQELAYRAALENVKQGKQFMDDALKDFKESGASDVQPVPGEDDLSSGKTITGEDARAAGRAAAKKMLGKTAE